MPAVADVASCDRVIFGVRTDAELGAYFLNAFERSDLTQRPASSNSETLRCMLEEVVRDSFEIRGGLLGPPEFHQRRD
jgi:hypothetical protein